MRTSERPCQRGSRPAHVVEGEEGCYTGGSWEEGCYTGRQGGKGRCNVQGPAPRAPAGEEVTHVVEAQELRDGVRRRPAPRRHKVSCRAAEEAEKQQVRKEW